MYKCCVNEIYQKTLLNNLQFEGIGLHSGLKSKMKVLPAKENSGIIFKRTDLEDNNVVKANINNVSSAKLCTTIENEFGVKVSTVEHLMSAFYMTGIDNAIVEIDSIEVPIMDGSSKDFVEEIKRTGLKIQSKKIKYLKILKKCRIQEDQKFLELNPNILGLGVSFQLNYKNELMKIKKAVDLGNKLGLEVHAGHGLTYQSAKILSRLKGIQEYNIGHFLIGEAIFVGLSNSIKLFKKILKS